MFNNLRVSRCPKIGEINISVILSMEDYATINFLVSQINHEFMVYLIGDRVVTDNQAVYKINSLIFPSQKMSKTAVETEEPMPKGCIGILHSHVKMGAFHSGTDEKGVDNAPLSIVVSASGDSSHFHWCAKATATLPCGRTSISSQITFIILTDLNLSPTLNTEFLNTDLPLTNEESFTFFASSPATGHEISPSPCPEASPVKLAFKRMLSLANYIESEQALTQFKEILTNWNPQERKTLSCGIQQEPESFNVVYMKEILTRIAEQSLELELERKIKEEKSRQLIHHKNWRDYRDYRRYSHIIDEPPHQKKRKIKEEKDEDDEDLLDIDSLF